MLRNLSSVVTLDKPGLRGEARAVADSYFDRLRREAEEASQREPDIAGFLHETVLAQKDL